MLHEDTELQEEQFNQTVGNDLVTGMGYGFMHKKIGLRNTILSSYVICFILLCVTATNFDAFSRNLIMLGKHFQQTSGAMCMSYVGWTFKLLLTSAVLVFTIFLVSNGARLAINRCQDDMINLDYGEFSIDNLYKVYNIKSSFELQLKCTLATCVAFPISWMLIVSSYLCILFCYDPPAV